MKQKEVKEFLKQFYLRSEEKIVFISLKENGTFEAITVVDYVEYDVELYRYGYGTDGIVAAMN